MSEKIKVVILVISLTILGVLMRNFYYQESAITPTTQVK